jgi:hypothetical protein
LTAKLHLACEQGPKPLSIVVTGGQRGDSPQFIAEGTALEPSVCIHKRLMKSLRRTWPPRGARRRGKDGPA